MIEALSILRNEYQFRGYIHAKAVPGTSPELVEQLGHLADRMSVNMELPSRQSLALLAPDKSKQNIVAPMRQIKTPSPKTAIPAPSCARTPPITRRRPLHAKPAHLPPPGNRRK